MGGKGVGRSEQVLDKKECVLEVEGGELKEARLDLLGWVGGLGFGREASLEKVVGLVEEEDDE